MQRLTVCLLRFSRLPRLCACCAVLCCAVSVDLVLSAAAACTYCVYALSADVIVFMASIEHRDTLEAAFIGGGVVLGSAVAFLSIARRVALRIHLAPLYRQCLRRVRNDENVKRLIGHRLLAGPYPAAATVATAAKPTSPAASLSSADPTPPATLSAAASGFRLVNCLPPGPRWRREPGVTNWYESNATARHARAAGEQWTAFVPCHCRLTRLAVLCVAVWCFC